MPYRLRKVCRNFGCHRVVSGRGGLCDQCRSLVKAHRRDDDRQRATPSARGYDWQWKKRRKALLAARPMCEWPGCEDPANEVDHWKPKMAGGSDDDANLQVLCRRHHGLKTIRFDQRGITAPKPVRKAANSYADDD